MSNKNNNDLKINDMFIEETIPIDESEYEPETETEVISDTEDSISEDYVNEVSGYVNCLRLNVRKDKRISVDNVIGKLKEDDEVSINLSESEDIWYKISTKSGLEGYCLKEFIDLKQ